MTLPSSMDDQPSSILYELARNINTSNSAKQTSARYNEILQRITTHPKDTKYRCPTSGSTALHWILSAGCPPLSVVQAAINVNPSSLSIKDYNDSTPYDMALAVKVTRENKSQRENLMSFLNERKKEMVRGALDNLFFVRDNVETLGDQFKQLKRENAMLSSQIDYVMETCTIFQKENSDLKVTLDTFIQENQKVQTDGLNFGKKEKENLTNLISTVEAIQVDIKELKKNAKERKQEKEGTPKSELKVTSHVAIKPKQNTTPHKFSTPAKFADNTHLTKDLVNQLKTVKTQITAVRTHMDDLEEERDNADLERRQLFDQLKKVTAQHKKMEEKLNDRECASAISQRLANYEINNLEKEVENSMAHNKGLERTVQHLKAERLILLRGSKREKDKKTVDSQGFHIAPLSHDGSKPDRSFEIEMLHDKIDLLERIVQQTQTEFDERKCQNELHNKRISVNRSKCDDTSTSDVINDKNECHLKYEEEKQHLQELQNNNRTIQQEISYLRAERLVLMNYRHGSEIQRKRDWAGLHKIQSTVEKLQNSYDTIEASMRKRSRKKNIKGTGATDNEGIKRGRRKIYDTTDGETTDGEENVRGKSKFHIKARKEIISRVNSSDELSIGESSDTRSNISNVSPPFFNPNKADPSNKNYVLDDSPLFTSDMLLNESSDTGKNDSLPLIYDFKKEENGVDISPMNQLVDANIVMRRHISSVANCVQLIDHVVDNDSRTEYITDIGEDWIGDVLVDHGAVKSKQGKSIPTVATMQSNSGDNESPKVVRNKMQKKMSRIRPKRQNSTAENREEKRNANEGMLGYLKPRAWRIK